MKVFTCFVFFHAKFLTVLNCQIFSVFVKKSLKIIYPNCQSTRVKKNGHIHNKKQNYKCLDPKCLRQFVLNPTKKYISDSERDFIKKLLLERLSLEGICRVTNVSMTWLLKFIKTTYDDVPDDLNVVINREEIEQYPEERFDEKVYSLLEKKKI